MEGSATQNEMQKAEDVAAFFLTAITEKDSITIPDIPRKKRGDDSGLAVDILEDINTDSIRSLRRSFEIIGGEDGVQEVEFVKMMLAYLAPNAHPHGDDPMDEKVCS